MRILIVGGGIAGLTLAALLRQKGIRPVVAEKSESYAGVGYVLGLWSIGTRVLHGLGAFPLLVGQSQPMNQFLVYGERGRVLRKYDFADFAERCGAFVGIRRAALIEVLRRSCSDVDLRFGRTVDRIEDDGNVAAVAFSDGTSQAFDLVVGCDGLRSKVRELAFGEVLPQRLGWSGWAWWVDHAAFPPETAVEHWGVGRWLGLYPGRNCLCCFCALPARAGDSNTPEERNRRLQSAFAGLGGFAPQALRDLPAGPDVWHDEFMDLQMPEWSRGRVVLIGDASAAILPTAGIGASMALESAAVLADELGRADARSVQRALHLFVARRRKRVDRVQTESRRLGELALTRSPTIAWLRNKMVPLLSERRLLGSLGRLLEEPC